MARGTKMVKQIFLHTCSFLAMLFRVTFEIFLSKLELAVLHFTIITNQKVIQIPSLQSNL